MDNSAGLGQFMVPVSSVLSNSASMLCAQRFLSRYFMACYLRAWFGVFFVILVGISCGNRVDLLADNGVSLAPGCFFVVV